GGARRYNCLKPPLRPPRVAGKARAPWTFLSCLKSRRSGEAGVGDVRNARLDSNGRAGRPSFLPPPLRPLARPGLTCRVTKRRPLLVGDAAAAAVAGEKKRERERPEAAAAAAAAVVAGRNKRDSSLPVAVLVRDIPPFLGHRFHLLQQRPPPPGGLDEKERFDPTQFQDCIIQGLNETGTPGGTLADDMMHTDVCVFAAQEDLETMQAFAQLLLFLKGFSESERNKLAMLTGILLANGTLNASILNSLYNENLVKEGVSAAFAVKLFKSWINEKDINAVAASLRKVNMDNRLMELFPANKQSLEHFTKYFTDAGLKELSEYVRNQQCIGARKELQKELQEQMSRGDTFKDIIPYVKEEMKKNNISEQTVIGIIWSSVMSTVEWNKKEELVAEQAIKHLKQYSPLLAAFTTQGQSELTLLLKIQEYCYDNIHFMKAFPKIVVLFYKAEVLSEEPILKWYKDAHLAKGKSVFLEQMKKFNRSLKLKKVTKLSKCQQ
ncbi:hypothetical protein E2320_020061, partial [Naja naja]